MAFQMNIFQKKPNPRKLSIREMWELYNLLRKGIGTSHQEYLVDEVYEMLDKLSKYEFIQSLKLMYDTVSLDTNPIQLAAMFIAGLKKNEFFFFDDIVKGFAHGRSAK